MAENTYSVAYSTNARAKCKYSGCGETIAKDEIRFTKTSPSAFGDKPKCEYYHAKCMFLSFVRARKTTKKIDSLSDIESVGSLKKEDSDAIKKYLKEFQSGAMKDQIPKITRKRKADDGNDDSKKKRAKKTTSHKKSDDEESEEGYKPKAKTSSRKRKQDSDDDDEPKLRIKLKDSKGRSKTIAVDSEDESEEVKNMSSEEESKKTKSKPKKQQDSDDESEEEQKPKKTKIVPKGKSKLVYSDEEDSEEKPKSKIPIKSKGKKMDSDDESVDSSEEEKSIKKKQKSKKDDSDDEEDEEVKESNSDGEAGYLSGKVIAVCGKLSISSDKVADLIKKNGGKYVKTITKEVTHVIVANKEDKSQKLQKARASGKKLVGESFLKTGK